MKPSMYAHADANSFYASCEQLFIPALKSKPVIVLSNNDGCVIARSAEAKPHIPMGAPIHQWQHVVEQQHIQVFSANFALYGDLSARLMSVIGRFTSRMEVYSVDEAFLDFSAVAPEALVDYSLEVKRTVKQWLGLPVSIGVGGTKTLAKLANKAAKKGDTGVLALQTEEEIDTWLAQTAVEDIWGIGAAHTRVLRGHNISTALELKHANERWVKQYLHLPGLRTVLELRGISCIPMEEVPQPKQQIAVTRSFGHVVESLAELREAVAFYCLRAGEKLREQQSLAGILSVFIATNPFQPDKPQYSRSCAIHLAAPTNQTNELIASAFGALRQLYREGYQYHRAGVFLQELVPDTHRQLHLFSSNEGLAERQEIAETIDRINTRFGHETIWYAAAGLTPGWKMRQEHRSPRYTTRLAELPLVR